MDRELDPEDRAAIARAQQNEGQKHNRIIDRRIAEAVRNAEADGRARQNEHPDQ